MSPQEWPDPCLKIAQPPASVPRAAVAEGMYSEWRPTTGNLSRANTGRLHKVHDFLFHDPANGIFEK